MEGTLIILVTVREYPKQCFLVSSGREKEPLLKKGTYSHDTDGRQKPFFILRQFDAI